MKYFSLFIIIFAVSLFALKEYEYARIVTDEKGMQAIKVEGYDILRESFTKKANEYSFEIYVDKDGIEKLRQMGFEPEIRIDNRTVKERIKGYHTNDQIGQELDSLQTVYPDICERLRIGSSVEERPLWALRIFDKNSSRDLRPEFKYTSTMHGDEVVGMELCMELIYDIIDGYYAENDTMKYIVENTDLYILPLHNPDGNFHNTRYNANGYDLNRSFPEGVYYETDTVDESELPEVAAMIDWNKERNFVLSANFHGGALVANYLYDKEFGISSGNYAACPDDAHVTWLAYNYASRNAPMFGSTAFPDGITNGSEWYSIDGGMQDWNYRYHNDIDMTLEVSNTKWPSYSTIPSFWSDNRSSMLWYLMAVHRGIKGKVTSSLTGKPLEASISVDGIEKDYHTIASTGEYYRILKPGSYSLTVEAEGFSTASFTDIVVKDSLATVLNIELDSVCSIGQGNSLPEGVSLHQNYPNPFNPETKIGFTVKKTSKLSLTVYNKKGESVQVLADKKHTPGNYLYRFNGKKFSAGEYYYELRDQNGGKDTKKMLMLK